MAEVDPETLLVWLNMGQGNEREMQLIALEKLCVLLLMSDNVDRCFESCPPRIFLPTLCHIFLDDCAPDIVLEVTARAITYYLDVSAECTRCIVAVDGAIKAMCKRLVVADVTSRTSKDLAEQCIKVLELICTREAGSVFEAGGLNCVLSFIRDNGSLVHKDTLHSAMAVASRLCGKMEPHDSSLPTCVEALSILLRHEDNRVADGALRCFASLADRFLRRGIDPAPLVEHGLVDQLLVKLNNVASPSYSAAVSSIPGASDTATAPEIKASGISTTISLLSTLCQGSPTITHDLLRSHLPDSIESALQGDERYVLDTMRLVDLLLVLLFEGHKALPKLGVTSVSTRLPPSLRRADSAGEHTHRQLIDSIRSKDTDALIDAIDSGGIEVNFMDNVGQTLLNWASAYGTQEMVEFLCDHGADVNKGQRSSSLHYAARFGRPGVAKVLLRHGANPDLRDEDGKTPLDRARVRNDEGYREVAAILQSPGEWMCPVADNTKPNEKKVHEPEDDDEPKGDPEMSPTYLQKLLPIFCMTFQHTMIHSVRKSSLNLIRKMTHYMQPSLLKALSSPDTGITNFSAQLVEVISSVLDSEEEDDSLLISLHMIQDLMTKGADIFLEHFACLGVFSKVLALAGPPELENGEKLKLKEGVKVLAREIYDYHFKSAQAQPRGMVAKLCNIVVQIDHACKKQVSNLQESSDWRNILSNALDELVLLLQDERAVSAYELHSSGLVQALQKLLGKNNYEECSMFVCHSNKLQKDRASVFKKCFKDRSFNDGPVLPSVALVRKLIAVLESIEKLPVYLYNTPGAGFGLQKLTRRLRFRLERAFGEVTLIDRTGRGLKMEPLTTVGQLEKYLVKMVAKEWYDYDRSTFTFVKKLKEPNVKITFTHRKDFDDNGVIYWIGTNARTSGEWVNPAQVGLVVVTSSEGQNLPYGRLEDILNRDSSALNCHSSDDKQAWFSIDLGLWLVPNCYTLRHAGGYERSALRNWFFQVSKDGVNWTTLYTHSDDCSLNEPGSTASWPLDPPPEETQGWRHIRLQQTGKNASGQTHYLSLSGFEIYGTVTGVCGDLAPDTKTTTTDKSTKSRVRFFHPYAKGRMHAKGPVAKKKVMTNVSTPVATLQGIPEDSAPDTKTTTTDKSTKSRVRFFHPYAKGRMHAKGPVAKKKVMTNVSTPVAILQGIPEDSGGPLGTAQSYPSLTATATASTSSGSQSVNASPTASSFGQSLTMSLASTSSESEQDFLESCSSTTLIADLDDDELPDPDDELPDPDDENEDEDDDDYEDENEDDDDYEDVLEEEGYELRNGKSRNWDDEFVLKRQFSALIPAFDPRPGRTNMNQTTDLEIPPPGSEESTSEEIPSQPKLSLQLKGPNIPSIPDVVLDLVNPEWTIFHAVQHLIQASELGTCQEKIRRVWEPTYVIVYKEDKEGEKKTKQYAPKPVVRNASKDGSKSWDQSPSSCSLPCVSMESTGCTVEEVLQVLRLIYVLSKETQNNILESAWEDFGYPVPSDDFISKKITNKLVQQIQVTELKLILNDFNSTVISNLNSKASALYAEDWGWSSGQWQYFASPMDPLVLSSGAQPEWCEYLTYSCPMLFPFETRRLYFTCTAFEASRSIVWLQNQRDATMERNRGPSPRRNDPNEFRIGRLKHERVKVPRDDQLLDWAMQVMKIHAERKSILEVEFIDEEGTGLGPTLEFYALVAAELQRRDLGLWLCSDEPTDTTVLVADKNEAVKPPGFYIYSQCGLFPAPLLQDGDDIERVEQYFHFLGIFLAKALQDNLLVDLPLSRPFLKLMCHGEVLSKMREKEPLANQSLSAMVSSFTEDDLHAVLNEEQSKKTRKSKKPPAEPSYAWFHGILGQEDFVEVDPHRARFLQQLQELATQKLRILADRSLNKEDKANQLKNLTIPLSDTQSQSGMYVRIEDLGLTFQFHPSSKVYGFAAVDLKQDGENQEVILDNIEEYVELMTDFCLHTGIRKQMEAFKAGFNRVFPLEKLGAFSPEEVRLMLCGDQSPSWSRDDILAFTEPKLGYSKESPGFQRFVNVLVNMNGEDRKAFLQFATGCSSLPPGGLANLHPRLTIVRKVDATDGSYPSVNTCAHYLKLPDYSSEDIMREKLLAATKEKGFHLN